jgi:hypothetical protein
MVASCSRVEEAMRAAANTIPVVASDDFSHPLFADARVPNHYDPAWFCVRASWRAIFHNNASLTNRPRPRQTFNCVLYANTSGNCRAKFQKKCAAAPNGSSSGKTGTDYSGYQYIGKHGLIATIPELRSRAVECVAR